MKCFINRTFKLIFSFILLVSTPLYSEDFNKIIDDFTDNPHKRWQFYTDQVMGGVSQGRASIEVDSGEQYIRLEGLVSTVNNGGFIQIRTYLVNAPKEAEGILIKVRGNGEKYYMSINTTETIFLPQQYRFYYQASFSTSKDWSEVRLPFSNSFKRSKLQMRKEISAEKIKTIGFLAYGKDYQALLEVKYLSFY